MFGSIRDSSKLLNGNLELIKIGIGPSETISAQGLTGVGAYDAGPAGGEANLAWRMCRKAGFGDR